MGTPTEDRAEGTFDEVKGRAKSAWGNLTGDDKTKLEGEVDQVKGKARQGLADVKDAIDDTLDPNRQRRPTS